MTDDPVVAQVHEARAELAERFRNDFRAYCRHLKDVESRLPAGVVNFTGSGTAADGQQSRPAADPPPNVSEMEPRTPIRSTG